MGLESTDIRDGEGAALYILHTGSILTLQGLERLVEEISRQVSHQIKLLDVNSEDGEKVRDFYDITESSLPVAFIVRDDDTLTSIWTSEQIPDANTIAFQLRETSA